MSNKQKANEQLWEDFTRAAELDTGQLQAFKTYYELLIDWNTRFNLTTITDLRGVLRYHFLDSLEVSKVLDLSGEIVICDIGSGAGFPGLPLKIKYPHIRLILMEVSFKKRQFLKEVIRHLKLEGVELCELDFRSFIRTTEGQIDYFIARASLDPLELSRLFKPGCTYKSSRLIYLANWDWQPHERITHLVQQTCDYKVGNKKRKLVVMGLMGNQSSTKKG